MRGCLTNPFILFLLILLFLGFAGGPIGAGFLGVTKPTGLFGGPKPKIQLPAEGVLHFSESPWEILSFSLTNTMLTATLVTLILLFLAWRATRRMELVPRGVQNIMEMVVEFFVNLCESIAGKENGRRFLPLVATLFLFILLANWMEVIPFIGTVGVVEKGHEEIFRSVSIGGFKLFYIPLGTEATESEGLIPFFRPATTDVNIPLAMAIIGMLLVQYWGARSLGLWNYAQRFIAIRELFRGKVFTGVVDLAVGALEALSQGAQVISLTFRLFGNLFAGDVLIILMAFLFPLAWILPIYGLEIIIGLVQAFIFAMLILVFATLAVTAHEESHR